MSPSEVLPEVEKKNRAGLDEAVLAAQALALSRGKLPEKERVRAGICGGEPVEGSAERSSPHCSPPPRFGFLLFPSVQGR